MYYARLPLLVTDKIRREGAGGGGGGLAITIDDLTDIDALILLIRTIAWNDPVGFTDCC